MSLAGQNDSDWYRQSFGDLYSIVYSHRSAHAAENEIRRLAQWAPLKPGNRVLDVCCGNGRHLQTIVELGCNGIGFDLSPELIDDAGRKNLLQGRIFRGDIRKIPVKKCFDRVLNLFTSFGYFQADYDNEMVFQEMARCVKPGGVLILDHMNAQRIRETLVPESRDMKAGYDIVQQRQIKGKRVKKRISVTREGSGRCWEFNEDVRMYSPEELISMADKAKFKEITLHGSFAGEPFSGNSERMILRCCADE